MLFELLYGKTDHMTGLSSGKQGSFVQINMIYERHGTVIDLLFCKQLLQINLSDYLFLFYLPVYEFAIETSRNA